jgi:hypothetical protein
MHSDRGDRPVPETPGECKAQQLFLATTPYHVLLSCALAEEGAEQYDSHILLFPFFAHAPELMEALRQGTSMFASCVLFPDVEDTNYRGCRVAIEQVREQMRRYPQLGKLLVFNDRHFLIQAAMDRAQRLQPEVHVTYVEDGSAAYSSTRFRQGHLRVPTIKGKIRYGLWYERIGCLGTSRWIDDMRIIYPKFARAELAGLPAKEIDRDAFHRVLAAEWVDLYMRMLGSSMETTRSSDLILLAPEHKGMCREPRLLDGIRSVVAQAVRESAKIAVKYHPREDAGDYLEIGQHPGASVVPRGLPAECLFQRSGGRTPVILGADTTSIITARWLLGPSTIVSVAKLMRTPDETLMELFDKLDIILPSDTDELLGMELFGRSGGSDG